MKKTELYILKEKIRIWEWILKNPEKKSFDCPYFLNENDINIFKEKELRPVYLLSEIKNEPLYSKRLSELKQKYETALMIDADFESMKFNKDYFQFTHNKKQGE